MALRESYALILYKDLSLELLQNRRPPVFKPGCLLNGRRRLCLLDKEVYLRVWRNLVYRQDWPL